MRLLNAILERGLAPDERVARGLILAGRVRVNGRPSSHEGREVDAGDALEVELAEGLRGERKLTPVLAALGRRGLALDLEGRTCADIGCSTGGFTRTLLSRGAARVYAVDVGYGVLAHELRTDPRVVVLERTNARQLSPQQIPEPLERLVGDLSFISWRPVLPALKPLLAPGAMLLLLVKPQFELAAQGRGAELAQGIADESLAREALVGLYPVWKAAGLAPLAALPAGLTGAKGNQEYFVLLQEGREVCSAEEYGGIVDAALGVSA